MRIPLEQFEQIIDPAILKRGLVYFKKGQVDPPDHLSDHDLEVVVHGTEDYLVSLRIEGNTIMDFVCDCPYDTGPVCKHVAAVIFYLLKDEIGLAEQGEEKVRKETILIQPKRGRPKNRKTEEIQTMPFSITEVPQKPVSRSKGTSEKIAVQKLLEGLSHDELREYVRNHVLTDKKQVAAFILTFGSASDVETQALYAKQVRAILNAHGGRGGFIEYRQAGMVGSAVYQMIVQAQQHLLSKRYRSAMLIACAVLEEMVKALSFADDSNGDIGGNVESACSVLHELSKAALPEDVRKDLFVYALSHYAKQTFHGWDWHQEMAELAISLHQTKDEAIQIRKVLKQYPVSGYELEGHQIMMYQLTHSIDGPEAAQEYLHDNTDNRKFREIMIREALDQKNFERVKQLAQEGIAKDLKHAPGYVHIWYDWLIKMARAQQDQTSVVKYARKVLLEHSMDPKIYYYLLKECIPSHEWTSFVDGLIQDIRANPKYRQFDFIPVMLAQEEAWDKMLSFIQETFQRTGGDRGLLDEYNTPLASLYPDEYIRLYQLDLEKDVRHLNGRNDYQRFCQQLRRLKKLGFKKQVSDMVDVLRKEYPKRPALLEELNGV